MIDMRYSLVQYVTNKEFLIVHFSDYIEKTEDQDGLNKILTTMNPSNSFYFQRYNNVVLHDLDQITVGEDTIEYTKDSTVVLSSYEFEKISFPKIFFRVRDFLYEFQQNLKTQNDGFLSYLDLPNELEEQENFRATLTVEKL